MDVQGSTHVGIGHFSVCLAESLRPGGFSIARSCCSYLLYLLFLYQPPFEGYDLFLPELLTERF